MPAKKSASATRTKYSDWSDDDVVTELCEIESGLNEWCLRFVDDVAKHVKDKKRPLSAGQRKKAEEILAQGRGDPRAVRSVRARGGSGRTGRTAAAPRTVACSKCGHHVLVSESSTTYPWSYERGALDFARPIYSHPGCLADRDAVLRRACDHGSTKVGAICGNEKCGLRVL